jgi:hypothetical protein
MPVVYPEPLVARAQPLTLVACEEAGSNQHGTVRKPREPGIAA